MSEEYVKIYFTQVSSKRSDIKYVSKSIMVKFLQLIC